MESDYGNLTSSSQSNPILVPPPTPEPTQTPKPTNAPTSIIESDPTTDTDRDYPSASVLKVFSGSTLQIAVNDILVNFTDAQPLIDSNDRTQVPIRAVSEMLDCDVEWISETHTAIITRENGDTIIIVIGSDTMLVNGNKVKMDTAALIKNDRTYIPVRFVAEALGLTVEWE